MFEPNRHVPSAARRAWLLIILQYWNYWKKRKLPSYETFFAGARLAKSITFMLVHIAPLWSPQLNILNTLVPTLSRSHSLLQIWAFMFDFSFSFNLSLAFSLSHPHPQDFWILIRSMTLFSASHRAKSLCNLMIFESPYFTSAVRNNIYMWNKMSGEQHLHLLVIVP